MLSKYNYRLQFQADQLEPVESRKGQDSLSLALAFNSKLISQILREKIASDAVATFSEERRLQLVERLCKHLALLSVADSHARSQPFQHTLPM